MSWSEVCRIDVTETESLLLKGTTLDKMVRCEEAVASYDKALEIKPDFELAQQNRRAALTKLNSPLRRLKAWVRNLWTRDSAKHQ